MNNKALFKTLLVLTLILLLSVIGAIISVNYPDIFAILLVALAGLAVLSFAGISLYFAFDEEEE